MPLEELLLPLVEDTRESDVPLPEEYDYWCNREKRIFYIDYEINDDYRLIELSKAIVRMNFEERNIPKEELLPIYIFIHSYGGDIESSFYFCDLIISSRIPVITVGMGACMSAAFLIFLSGHKRYAFNHTQMLAHSGSAGFQGTAEQIEEAQKNYKKQINDMKEYILKRTSIDEKLFNKNKAKDWYLNSDDLIKYNVIDKFVEDINDIFDGLTGEKS